MSQLLLDRLTELSSVLNEENTMLMNGRTTDALKLLDRKKAAITALNALRPLSRTTPEPEIPEKLMQDLEDAMQDVVLLSTHNGELLQAALDMQQEIVSLLTTIPNCSDTYGARGAYRPATRNTTTRLGRGLAIPPA